MVLIDNLVELVMIILILMILVKFNVINTIDMGFAWRNWTWNHNFVFTKYDTTTVMEFMIFIKITISNDLNSN